MKSIIYVLIFTSFSLGSFAQEKSFNILDFGAKLNSSENCAKNIQLAINLAAKQGGGRVVIPRGQFISGPIELKSGVELHLTEGAELFGSIKRLEYGQNRVKALIYADGQTGISLSGRGIINGRGREVVKDLLGLLHQKVLTDPTWQEKRPSEHNRPQLVAFENCRDISVKNITLKNSAGWVQNYVGCTTLHIDSVTVESTEYWNNDGIDIVNSKSVRITNCIIDAADDGICLKSEGKPGICQNVYIENCKIRSSASGFKIGTGSHGGFRNITVKNITVSNTFRSAIAIEAVDGGFIENVSIDRVIARYTGNAIFIRLGHRNKNRQYSTIKNISISNLIADIPNKKPDAGYPVEGPLPKGSPHNLLPASIVGIPNHLIENLVLSNIEINYGGGAQPAIAHIPITALSTVPENEEGYPEFSMFGELPSWALYVRHVKGIRLKNIKFSILQPDFRPPIVLDDVHSAIFNGLNIGSIKAIPLIVTHNTSSFALRNAEFLVPIKEAVVEILDR